MYRSVCVVLLLLSPRAEAVPRAPLQGANDRQAVLAHARYGLLFAETMANLEQSGGSLCQPGLDGFTALAYETARVVGAVEVATAKQEQAWCFTEPACDVSVVASRPVDTHWSDVSHTRARLVARATATCPTAVSDDLWAAAKVAARTGQCDLAAQLVVRARSAADPPGSPSSAPEVTPAPFWWGGTVGSALDLVERQMRRAVVLAEPRPSGQAPVPIDQPLGMARAYLEDAVLTEALLRREDAWDRCGGAPAEAPGSWSVLDDTATSLERARRALSQAREPEADRVRVIAMGVLADLLGRRCDVLETRRAWVQHWRPRGLAWFDAQLAAARTAGCAP